MTLGGVPFAALLALLASETAGDAKASEPRELRFDLPPPSPLAPRGFHPRPPTEMNDRTITERNCCALQIHSWFGGSSLTGVLHRYRGLNTAPNDPMEVGTGFLYTRRGGIIDLGHVRDAADYVRFFANQLQWSELAGRGQGAAPIMTEQGNVQLVIEPRSAQFPPHTSILVGAKLAYDRAIWHEIAAFVADPVSAESRFSPEDNFSNAIGALVGFRAMLRRDLEFDAAVAVELLAVLDNLQPLEKDDAEFAKAYVNGHWWGAVGHLKRFHFNATGTVTPWLVTDIAVPGKDAAAVKGRLGRPTAVSVLVPDLLDGGPIDSIARLHVKNVAPALLDLLPQLPVAGEVRSSDFRRVIGALRAHTRIDEGNEADSPGPPMP